MRSLDGSHPTLRQNCQSRRKCRAKVARPHPFLVNQPFLLPRSISFDANHGGVPPLDELARAIAKKMIGMKYILCICYPYVATTKVELVARGYIDAE